MKRKRRVLVFLTAAIVFLLAACKMSPEEVGTYAQSILDASYKADFDEYTKQTESTQEEAEQFYESNIDQMLTIAGCDSAGLSDELLENYRQLFKDMLALAEYEVGEVTEEEDGSFTVSVSAKPLVAFEGLQAEVTAAVQEELADITDVSQIPGQDEINEMVFQKVYDGLKKRMESPVYGDPQQAELHVSKDSDNVYSVSEEDLTALDGILFPTDGF